MIVPRILRMPGSELDAYLIEPEKKEFLKNMKSKESGLIDALEIDHISDVINQKTNQLLDLEYEDDM